MDLKFNEVCKILRITRPTLLKLIRSGEIPAHKVGKSWRFKKSDIIKGE